LGERRGGDGRRGTNLHIGCSRGFGSGGGDVLADVALKTYQPSAYFFRYGKKQERTAGMMTSAKET